jgi:hypothetical protein
VTGDDLLCCAGCGGDSAHEPVRETSEKSKSSERWCGGVLVMIVDGEARFVHHDDECVAVASIPLWF